MSFLIIYASLSALSSAVSGTRAWNQTTTERDAVGVVDSSPSHRAYSERIILYKYKEEFHYLFVLLGTSRETFS
jgi:hypothetical protein